MTAIEEFFASQQGSSGYFSFTDPWDEIEYLNCSLESDVIPLEFGSLFRGRTTLVVKENRD